MKRPEEILYWSGIGGLLLLTSMHANGLKNFWDAITCKPQPAVPCIYVNDKNAKPKPALKAKTSEAPVKRSEELLDERVTKLEVPYFLYTKDLDYLMSNEFFENTAYLSEAHIAHLLYQKNSCLKNKGVERMIKNAADKYRVNGMLLAGRLQVEQGLVTKHVAEPGELDYATGYGAYDGKKWAKSKGLEYQIENSARILRKHYDQFKGQACTIKNDGFEFVIYPKNAATYALYKYTPWVHGNELNISVIRRFIDTLNDMADFE